MVSCKDNIVIFRLSNTCYPQNLARNLARFFRTDIYRFPIDYDLNVNDDISLLPCTAESFINMISGFSFNRILIILSLFIHASKHQPGSLLRPSNSANSLY
jgi:hypothetical protein